MKMMNRVGISYMQEYVGLTLCAELHRLCVGSRRQFNYMSSLDFAHLLNLLWEEPAEVVRYREKRRVCYLVYYLSLNVIQQHESEHWIGRFLSLCNIDRTYYDHHYKDLENPGAEDVNSTFRKALEEAVERAKRFDSGL